MLQITFRNMLSSAPVWDLAEEKFVHLANRLRSAPFCSLVLAHQPEYARPEEQFCAHVDLRLGGQQELHATAEAEHAASAIREVFAMLELQLAARPATAPRSAVK